MSLVFSEALRQDSMVIQHEAFGKSTTVDGKMYDDTVTLGDLVIHKQSIGMVTEVKSTSMPFSNELEGVLGLGLVPLTLAAGDVSDNQLFPTVMDNLVARKLISEKILGGNRGRLHLAALMAALYPLTNKCTMFQRRTFSLLDRTWASSNQSLMVRIMRPSCRLPLSVSSTLAPP